MGYYSDFKVEAEPELEGLADLLQEYSGGYGFDYYDGAAQTNGKWYSSHSDIFRLSKAYPHILFTVEQVGEDGEGERYNIIDGEILTRWTRGWERVYE